MNSLAQFAMLERNLFKAKESHDIEREWIGQEHRGELKFPKLKIPDKAKAIVANISYVPALIASEHLATYFGVDVSSLPWQIAVTTGMFTLTYKIFKRYTKDDKKLPLHFIPNIAIVPPLFDRGSYGLFYLRNKGNVGRAGEWAKSVYPSSIARSLTSSIYGDMPILWVDVVAGSVYTTYLGFQTLDKKFGVAKKAKERMLDIYSKIYNNVNKFCEKSGIHKYLVRGALSLPLAASGAPLLSLAPMASALILDGMERVRRSQTKANSLILRC